MKIFRQRKNGINDRANIFALFVGRDDNDGVAQEITGYNKSIKSQNLNNRFHRLDILIFRVMGNCKDIAVFFIYQGGAHTHTTPKKSAFSVV